MKIRTLIVDDEPLARERLRGMLEAEPEIEVLAECGDGLSAVESIRTLAPDLVFLDIQMPGLDGFGVLNKLARSPLPAVVFVTAYDKFALKAFEVHAIDYLLKPFDRERFRKALQHVKGRLGRAEQSNLETRVQELLTALKSDKEETDRLVIKTTGKITFLKFEEIDWVEADDNYVNIHAGTGTHLLRETLTALEARLPAKKFARISRSAIVNLDMIKELQPLFHGEYAVILRNNTRLTLSRSCRENLNHLLGN
jgi:two-component system LytT family response regulator